MSEISRRQQRLLEMFKSSPSQTTELVYELYQFLRTKPEDESLNSEWQNVWEKIQDSGINLLPEEIMTQISAKIQAIEVVDREIWNIKIDSDVKVTFLIGAGASAASGIPIVNNLLPELLIRARKVGREDLDQLANWCEERKIRNIEDLLTAAYLSNFAAKNEGVVSLLDYFLFSARRERSEEAYYSRTRRSSKIVDVDVSSIGFLQDTLQTLFGLLTSTMISARPNPTHEAIIRFLEEHEETAIVTTNYDGCMDEAILKAKKELQTKGNGISAINTEPIKMHGSINWAYCDSCQDVHEFDLLELKDIFENDKLSFPVIGICKICGGLRRPLLVPPLSFKFLMFPNLIHTWNLARLRIEEAQYLIVIGYSFSEADTYITKIISRSMSASRTQKMIVVDTNPGLVRTMRKRYSARVNNFDENRILRVCDRSESILPDILNSLLGNREMGDETIGSKRTKSPRRDRKREKEITVATAD